MAALLPRRLFLRAIARPQASAIRWNSNDQFNQYPPPGQGPTHPVQQPAQPNQPAAYPPGYDPSQAAGYPPQGEFYPPDQQQQQYYPQSGFNGPQGYVDPNAVPYDPQQLDANGQPIYSDVDPAFNPYQQTFYTLPPQPTGPGWEPVIPTDIKSRQDYADYTKARASKLGSSVPPHYEPRLLVAAPPRARDIKLPLLLASQIHLGHSTSLWNPLNQRYIFGVRQGIHIFSLETIAAHLKRAASVVEGVARAGGIILFVGTRPGMDRIVVEAARRAGGFHLFDKWIPGSITNRGQILKGSVGWYDMRDKKVDRNGENLKENAAAMEETAEPEYPVVPDLVVCLNPLENQTLLHECGLAAVPTIGLIDSDADPRWVTYTIPGNDDSLRAVSLVAGILGRAGESGRKKRIEEAEKELKNGRLA